MRSEGGKQQGGGDRRERHFLLNRGCRRVHGRLQKKTRGRSPRNASTLYDPVQKHDTILDLCLLHSLLIAHTCVEAAHIPLSPSVLW